ncbi:MAG: sigma-70 family RNA polymerase sigma factor, partial [Bacteroidales bacterium]|nr:sigma-70 family RNA polymerase sigma factor [Bacteroidales bacterium]
MKKSSTNKRDFANLLKKNKGIIHKVSLLYTNNQADREDLFQDICMQLWKSYNSFRNEAQFSTWMYRVAINTAISQVRKKKKEFFPLDTYMENLHDSNNIEKDDRKQLLFIAISRLNKIDKALILLWLEEKKYEDISDILGI